jgi:hypothetical protein
MIKFYVYAYLRMEDFTPYYIGKGVHTPKDRSSSESIKLKWKIKKGN